METCKFYVSPVQPECGVKSEGQVITRLSDGGKAVVELCGEHLTQHRTALAEAARRRLEAKEQRDREALPYRVKGGVTQL